MDFELEVWIIVDFIFDVDLVIYLFGDMLDDGKFEFGFLELMGIWSIDLGERLEKFFLLFLVNVDVGVDDCEDEKCLFIVGGFFFVFDV